MKVKRGFGGGTDQKTGICDKLDGRCAFIILLRSTKWYNRTNYKGEIIFKEEFGMNEEKIPIWYDMYRQIEYGGNVKPDELMYHYTSADGLMGIIGKEHVKFRFTKYSVLNDTQEGKMQARNAQT